MAHTSKIHCSQSQVGNAEGRMILTLVMVMVMVLAMVMQ